MHKPIILQTLNPADNFTLAMDQEMRDEGMPGSLCGFALALSKQPDITELKLRIHAFTQQFPVSLASLQQHGRHFYWCQREQIPKSIFFQHFCPDESDEVLFQQSSVEQIFNQQLSRESILPLEFHLLSGATQHTLVMRWIHPFCDARGADLILKYLCTDTPEQRLLFDTPKTAPLVDLQLQKFNLWQKFGLFLKAKRHIQELDRLSSIIQVQPQQQPQQLHFQIQRLTAQQTAIVAKKTRAYVGLTGTSLYYMGCLMRALEKINPDSSGAAYCIPYAFNLRKQKALSPMLGNHVAALFAQAPRTLITDKKQLFLHLKKQNNNAIRQQLDYAFLPLMWAGRWLSLQKYGKHLRQSYQSGTERSSFWFSDIGQPDLSGMSLLGAEINGLFHLCQVTSPPALGLLSCTYQKRLTLTYNYIEPLIKHSWIEKLQTLMLAELLDETA